MSQEKIWVFTPCYFDTASFQTLREKIKEQVSKLGSQYSIQFVLIDDTAGADPQISKLKSESQTAVLQVPFNLGHQRAIVYALRRLRKEIADNDYVVTLDSDGEDRPDDFPQMLSPLVQASADKAEIVVAKRTRRHVGMKFKVLYACFVILFRILTGKIVRSGNFAAFRGATLRKMISHPFFNLCYSSSLLNVKIPVVYVPCERGKRYFDQSKMGYFNLLMHGFRMLMPFMDRIAIRALVLSFISFAVSAMAGLTMLGLKLLNHAAFPSWLGQLVFFSTTIALLSIGIFVILFSQFTQTQSLELKYLDSEDL